MKFRIALVGIILSLIACSSGPKLDPATPDGAYALGEKYEKDERYEEALAQYASVKNKHPYSNFATESELRIAEIHFKREDFADAQSAYEAFKEMHPTHAKSDYITFRLGLSIFEQLPSTTDRDLTLADKALLYFDEVLTSYPKSEHVAKASEYKGKVLHMMAEKELYIANFYFIRKMYDSALGRYEDLLNKYPNAEQVSRALKGAAISAYHEKEETKMNNYLGRLEKDFANSREYKDAKEATNAK